MTGPAVDQDVVVFALEEQAESVRKGSEGLLSTLWPEMSDHDKEFVDDIGIRRIIADIHVEALSNKCVDGWIDDVIAIRRPWKFELADIRVPVKLWGGQDDVFSPVGHTYWLAQQIDGAKVEIEYGKAHFGTVKILPRILTWVARKANAERQSELVPCRPRGPPPSRPASGTGSSPGRCWESPENMWPYVPR